MLLNVNLNSDISFSPKEGAFRTRLIEAMLECVEEYLLDTFSEELCDVVVHIHPSSFKQQLIHFMVISDLGELSFEIKLEELSKIESEDFKMQIYPFVEQQRIVAESSKPKVIVRKKPRNGMVDEFYASKQLGCSAPIFKKVVPCTDYSYTEINGVKTIKDYWWSINLVDHLVKMKQQGASSDDIRYIADECCNGDSSWSSDLLRSIGILIQTQETEFVDVDSSKNNSKSSRQLGKSPVMAGFRKNNK